MPRLLGVGGVVDLGGVAVPLGPAQVHPQQHLGEVGGVDPAGLGPDGDQGLAGVVLPGQQGAHLELAERRAQRGELALGLLPGVGVVLALGELDQHLQVVEPRGQRRRAAPARTGRGRTGW